MIQKIEIQIPVQDKTLPGFIMMPEKPLGLVIFSHGSGSSRFSKRNNWVAQQLQKAGFATLLFDLLTEEEDLQRVMRFDIPLLTERLKIVTQWCKDNDKIGGLNIGFFGASTGAASALRAAADDKEVKAVVSRGGRPDLAGELLSSVTTPVLLVVGGKDGEVIHLNEQAFKKLAGERELVIVKNATHLFPEEGALDKVAELSINWFGKFLKNNHN